MRPRGDWRPRLIIRNLRHAFEPGTVTRLSAATLRELTAQLPQDAQPRLWDRTKAIELTVQDKRYVIAGGQQRKQRDWADARLA
jgi:hypothetical protein